MGAAARFLRFVARDVAQFYRRSGMNCIAHRSSLTKTAPQDLQSMARALSCVRAMLIVCVSVLGCAGAVDDNPLNSSVGGGTPTVANTGGTPSSTASGRTSTTDAGADADASGLDAASCSGFLVLGVGVEVPDASTCISMLVQRDPSAGCSIPLPQPPTGQALNVAELQVLYRSSERTTYELPMSDSYRSCNDSYASWYPDNLANPRSLNLCRCTCANLRSGVLEIRFAC